MYVTHQRCEGNTFQHTMSWRTGRLFKGENPREVVSNPPKPTGNVGKDLAARNEYYRRVAANMLSQPGYGSRGHVLTADGGHSFLTIRGMWRDGSWTQVHDTYGTMYKGRVAPKLVLDTKYSDLLRPFVQSAGGLPVNGHPSSNAISSALAGRVSSSITNMLPDHGEMGWFETIVELARGNLPKAIPDLARRIHRGRLLDPKGTGKDLGSDYLNLQFGIIPIARDVVALIDHLKGVNSLLYNSFKRSRKTYTLDTLSKENQVLGADNVLNNGLYTYSVRTGSYTVYHSTDTIVKAKFSKAQPTIAANQFLDEAEVNLRRLGLNEKLAWDLIPFSWLVDWSGNIGSSIENAAAFAPTIGRYLSQYMWATRQTVVSANAPGYEGRNGSSVTRVSPSWASVRVIDRTPVSPYGINFSIPSLSAGQWAILTALGLATMRR